METDKNYFTVGLFVIALIAAGVGFTLWLASPNRGEHNFYRIRFAESVGGLKEESSVKFRGVDVGTVKQIIIDPGDPKLIRVDIRVAKEVPVKADTTATLKLRGISGEIYVELSGGSENAPLLLSPDEKKPAELKAEPSSINAIMNGVPRLLDKANHIADQVDKVFSDQNVKAAGSMMRTLAKHYGTDEEDEKEKKKQQYPQGAPDKSNH